MYYVSFRKVRALHPPRPRSMGENQAVSQSYPGRSVRSVTHRAGFLRSTRPRRVRFQTNFELL